MPMASESMLEANYFVIIIIELNLKNQQKIDSRRVFVRRNG